ncbi:hypothetical protein DFH09DRAFT_1363782 [Mycena vulgaris]|nr:hypothetical protein DFH09DRAFT_1363782 [Mycena vulgaris]
MSTACDLPTNDVPCGGPGNIHDGCQEIFPYSDPSHKICYRCEKLSAPQLSDKDRDAIEKYKACSKCGLTGKRVVNPCGTCARRDADGVEDPAKAAARIQRGERAQKFFGTTSVAKPLLDTTNHQVGPSTSHSELSDIRSGHKNANWTLLFMVRIEIGTTSKIDGTFGTQSYSADPDDSLLAVLLGMLDVINLRWIKIDGHYMKLSVDHCELSFQNNLRIVPEAATQSVKGLYQFYNGRSDRALAFKANSKTKGLAKGTYMNMEVIVSKSRYSASLERVMNANPDSFSNISTTKRKGQATLEEQISKRARTETEGPAVILQSSFAPVAKSSAPSAFVQFTTITCEIVPETGEAVLSQSSIIQTGRMELTQLSGVRQTDLGKSKNVYKLRIEDAPGLWGLIENDVLLMRDLARIKRLGLFTSRFFEVARQTAAEVSEFTVSEAFVIVVQSCAVEKFSGTVGGSDKRTNKLSSTICALTHYILQATACKQAFTDLQGSLHCSRPGAAQEMVLFDPMSHSLSGTTGVGDHGPDGIEDTIKTHKCSFMCMSMNLANMPSIEATFAAEKMKLDNMDLGSQGSDETDDTMDGFVLHRAPSAEEVAASAKEIAAAVDVKSPAGAPGDDAENGGAVGGG